MTDAATVEGAPSTPVEQRSKILRFLWIGFYSAILTVFTLGIFQFWARTQQRRQMWKDTSFDGEPLEYTGKGSELFFGFLLALLVLSVAAALLVGVPLGLMQIDPVLGGVAAVVSGLLYFLALIALPGVAIFLARRYILSRTLWRGVRFEQGGDAVAFGFGVFVQNLLTFVTLGLYTPIAQIRIAEMFWSNAKFGDLKFAFDGQSSNRTEPIWPSFLLAYFANIIGVGAILYTGFSSGLFNPDISSDPMAMLGALGQFYAVVFAVVILTLLFASWFAAALIRQIIKLISLGSVKLTSNLGAMNVLIIGVTNLFLIVFTLGFGFMAAQMRVWRMIARSIEVVGTLDYAAIHQAASRGPSTGEGLATALDVGGAF